MKTLVTGGHGLLGTYLQKEMEGIYLNSKDFNLTKESEVIKMYETHQPDVVVHLAGKAGGMFDHMKNPFYYLEENILMNTYVMKYAHEFGVKKFVGTLSTCIYRDVAENYPLVEEELYEGQPHEFHIGYAYSKRLMGIHINVAKKQGLNYSYVVPSNLYGLYETGDITRKHFVGALIDKIIKANINGDKKITILGDGSPLRQFTYTEDVAKIIARVVKEDVSVNMNIATPENLSIAEMVRQALIATDSQHLEVEWDTTQPNGQYRKDVSVEKLQTAFPDFQFTSFVDGIRKTHEELKKKY